jgi:hypothetical protein
VIWCTESFSAGASWICLLAIRPAKSSHLAMRPPADQRAHLGVEALVRDEGFQDTHHRAQQEHNRSHCQEGGPVIGPDGRGLGHCQQIYQLPGKARQRRLGQREDQRQQH